MKEATPRQLEVLRMVAEGWSTKEIARSLGISIKTVEKHRFDVRQRLELRNTADMVRYAARSGLLAGI